MKNKIHTTFLFLACLCLIAGCATAPKYDPFVVSKAKIRDSIKTIAIYHPQTNNPVEVRFEQLIEEQLHAGGFATVSPDLVNPLGQKEKQSLGGIFDPQTGQEDKAKSDLFWRNFSQSLKTNCQADAMMVFGIVKRPAKFYGNRAEWDGTSEEVYMHYGIGDVLLANGTDYGTTEGLSLKVLLANLQHDNLYLNWGGIQLAAKLSRPSQAFRKNEFVAVPESDLFGDTNRIFGAVTNALGPLTH